MPDQLPPAGPLDSEPRGAYGNVPTENSTPPKKKSLSLSNMISGLGAAIRDQFSDKDKVLKDRRVGPRKSPDPGYPAEGTKQERIKFMMNRYYKEAAFEKIQFSRKWMRNALMLQGYHELEWSEINVAWEALIRDSGDYAFPNNYYRSHIMKGAGLYVKSAPEFTFAPTSDDFEAHAVASAARNALEVIKENVNYDYLRALEAIYLRVFGNSFRFSYYSLDSRYGFVTAPVYQEAPVQIDNGSWNCPQCGMVGDNQPAAPQMCPNCGSPQLDVKDPTVINVPQQAGTTKYARGREVCEVINPLEVYVRSSAPDLWHAPFLFRARVVDKLALLASHPDAELGYADVGNDAYASSEDISLIYQQSLADLPGDPTQYAAWYERAVAHAKATLLQGWFRPALYYHDEEMRKDYPDGIYAAVCNNGLLEARNCSMDDHWVHFPYNHVPGRFWADGDDDLVPKQLQLNENERLIMRNLAYNSVPRFYIDSQRINKNQIVNDPGELIEVKMGGGKPIRDAHDETPGMQLPNEVWEWRNALLQDMQYHSGVFPESIGAHTPGVDTLGGQQMSAARAQENMNPLLLIYKEGNELWAKQMLKIAARNWLDPRVRSVQGINGQWEFAQLRNTMLNLDMVQITARIIPINPVQQQSLIQAIASQALNPQDPRVQRKLLESFQLPTELGTFEKDAKVQYKEIEKMRQTMQVIAPVLIRDNDQVHIEICRDWLNSDEAEQNPQLAAVVMEHMQMHFVNMGKMMMAQTMQSGMSHEASVGQTPAGQQQGQQKQQPQQAGQRGGQVPQSGADRQQRAMKGRAAKPIQSQPVSGNQYNRQVQ